ncbi:MAG: cytochrome ubiquinol oxidase subunit I [Longimicrobiales bacterium]
MDDLLAARSQMAVSLAFHIVFAAIGIGLPLMMVISEWRWLRGGERVHLELTRAWAKGAAIFFAVGAVSGTVLSFELGLLWPRFMEYAGSLIGMPFSLEGFAFFTEAIFLGIYLYGWQRVRPWAHWWAGVVVAISGALSALFVLSVNGWMNAPTGFTPGANRPLDIDPLAAMANAFWIANTVHMMIAAYLATAFGAASVHAWMLLRDPLNLFHRKALRIALALGGVMALAQPISGDFNARLVHRLQPAKLAAMEGQFATERCAPLRIGGVPFPAEGVTRWALEIPCGLSLLAAHDADAEILGLDAFPADERPDPRIVHPAFQIMVGIGLFLVALTLWYGLLAWRRREPADSPAFLRCLVAAGPLAFIAIEAGWVVTEVGRQPWIIYGVMRTSEAVTPMPGLVVPFTLFTLLYLLLSFIVAYLLVRQVAQAPRFRIAHAEPETSDGPEPGASPGVEGAPQRDR